MGYDPKELKEMKVGTIAEAEVTELLEATLGEIVGDEHWEKFDKDGTQSRDTPALQVEATDEAGHRAKLLIRLPATSEVHPKSTMARWKRTYGAFPERGQLVKLMLDADGFYQLVLVE